MIRWRGLSRTADRVDEAPPADPVDGVWISPRLQGARDLSTDMGTAFHEIGIELVKRHLSVGRRGVAICGASQGSGVTFATAGLALALADAEVPTVIVEANLRRPSLAQHIRVGDPSLGLTDVLRGTAARSAVTHAEVIRNLSVIYAGPSATDSDQLLSGGLFQELLEELMREFACVIVDTPPANRYADARTAAAAVGYCLIVGRVEHSYLSDASLLSQQLRSIGVTIVGSIFNDG